MIPKYVLERSPDKEGIETRPHTAVQRCPALERSPDKEGIETSCARPRLTASRS